MGDFVLDSKDIGQIAIVAIGPDMTVVFAIDELCRDSHTRARLSNTSFENKINVEVLRHFRYFNGFAFVSEGGITCYNGQT